MCRRILAGAANMAGHEPETVAASNDQTEDPDVAPAESSEPQPSSSESSSPPPLLSEQCSGYFVQPLQWMGFLDQGELSGKIACPNEKCGTKVGNYDWKGVKCSCGQWVNPGFCIHRSKVDEIVV